MALPLAGATPLRGEGLAPTAMATPLKGEGFAPTPGATPQSIKGCGFSAAFPNSFPVNG